MDVSRAKVVKIVRYAVVASLVVGVVVAGWQIRELRSRATSAEAGAVGTGLTNFPGRDGLALADLQGPTIDGGSLSLRTLRGHVLVLNVWGSWCAPCREEAPDLAAISQETYARGVRFVGIDTRDNPASARAFERRYGITYPSFDDQDGQVLARLTGIVPIGAVPSTIVVDREGIVRARVVGRVEGSTLRGLIEDTEKLP